MYAGDRIVLKERERPKWTIESVQEYLLRDLNNHAMNEEPAHIEEFGEKSRNNF